MEKSLSSFLSRARLLISSSQLKLQIIFLIIGVFLVVGGLLSKTHQNSSNQNIEVLDTAVSENNQSSGGNSIVVDISGAVKNPGVYHLSSGDRVEDSISAAGGLSENADQNWIDKNLNRAAKLIDGQKVYIPSKEQSSVLSANNFNTSTSVAQSNNKSDSNLININTASLEEIESLPGIGQVYGQNIIDNRPYSNISELLNKQVLKESLYNKIKDKLAVY